MSDAWHQFCSEMDLNDSEWRDLLALNLGSCHLCLQLNLHSGGWIGSRAGTFRIFFFKLWKLWRTRFCLCLRCVNSSVAGECNILAIEYGGHHEPQRRIALSRFSQLLAAAAWMKIGGMELVVLLWESTCSWRKFWFVAVMWPVAVRRSVVWKIWQ